MSPEFPVFPSGPEGGDEDVRPFGQVLIERALQLAELTQDGSIQRSSALQQYLEIYLRGLAQYLEDPDDPAYHPPGAGREE